MFIFSIALISEYIITALEVVERIKQRAEEHPEGPPSGIIVHTEFEGLPTEDLSRIPERSNITKTIRRVRRRNLPPNPTFL